MQTAVKTHLSITTGSLGRGVVFGVVSVFKKKARFVNSLKFLPQDFANKKSILRDACRHVLAATAKLCVTIFLIVQFYITWTWTMTAGVVSVFVWIVLN